MEQVSGTAYGRNVETKNTKDQILYLKSLGWNIKGSMLYLCEYYCDGELRIDYFLGKQIKSEPLTIFTNLAGVLKGGAIKKSDGEKYSMECETITYEDIQEKCKVKFNCNIQSFIEYDELAKSLIESGEVIISSPEAAPYEILEYVRKNYTKVLEDKNAVLLRAIN